MKTLKKKIKETCNRLTMPLQSKIEKQVKIHPKRSGIIMFITIAIFFAYSISRVVYMHSDKYKQPDNYKPKQIDAVINSLENQYNNIDLNFADIYDIIMLNREVKKLLNDSVSAKDTNKWIDINNKLDNIINNK